MKRRKTAATRLKAMQSTVYVVTGASSGIGKATATGLAKQGAKVIMVCRDEVRGEAAKAEIEAIQYTRPISSLLTFPRNPRGMILHQKMAGGRPKPSN